MVALLAAWVVSTAAPAMTVRDTVAPLVLAKKKHKKPKAKEKEKEPPAETSEGLDLSAPTPAPTPEPSPAAEAAEPAVQAEAPAAKGDDTAWSLVTPDTAGAGANLLEAGVGWPGIYASYWRGVLAELDVGAKVGFDWSYEGILTGVRPGLRIQAQARYLIWDNGSLSLGVSLSPGALIYFFPTGAKGGLILPLAATLGLPDFLEKLNVSATFEIPFFVVFGVSTVVPLMLGGNAEYFLSDSLAVFARVKGGVAIFASGGGAFGILEGLVGAAYKL